MDTKTIGLVIAFTVLATVLNYIKIPVPYLPGFFYQMGDIILIVSLLFLGLKAAITVASLNMLLTIILFQNPAGPIGPPYYLISVLATFAGIYVAERVIRHNQEGKQDLAWSAGILTVSGILSRTLIMLPLDYFVYGFLVSIVSGLTIAESYAIVLFTLPSMIIYNITVPLIMIPLSYFMIIRLIKTRVFVNRIA